MVTRVSRSGGPTVRLSAHTRADCSVLGPCGGPTVGPSRGPLGPNHRPIARPRAPKRAEYSALGPPGGRPFGPSSGQMTIASSHPASNRCAFAFDRPFRDKTYKRTDLPSNAQFSTHVELIIPFTTEFIHEVRRNIFRMMIIIVSTQTGTD